MKPSVKSLGEILYAPSQYVIPVFQRNYRWEMPQWDKFWNSLLEIQGPEKRGNHFMGFLVFVPGLAQPGQHTTFHLIDGQQRLTTSSILLTALRNVARKLNETDLADEIHQDYLVHPRKTAEQHYRLLPKERDHDNFVSIIDSIGEPGGRVGDALAYFEEKLGALAGESTDILRTVFNVMCQRFEFMCATLEAENAYNIFKSLNSTGVPLGPADLIRNFMFMHVRPEDHDEFDSKLWAPLEARFSKPDGTLDEDRFSRFFRDYLMASGRYVPPKDTFVSFEAQFEATGFSPHQLATRLTESSRHYSIICGEAKDESQAVTDALSGLNALESSTTYPLVLALFQKRAAGILTDDELARAIHMLCGFILRRFICSESSRGYGQMFVRALAKDGSKPLETLERYLLERGWPDDHQFEAAFITFPLYQRGYTRQVLEILERSRGHKEPADLAAAQVEHVMPQTLNEWWRELLGPQAERIHAECLHRPGNLTLSAYNQELWNHSFNTKRDRYAESNIVITRQLADYERWGQDEIEKRGRNLANEAASIWIGPKDPLSPAPETDSEEELIGRRELRIQFWTTLSDYLAAEYTQIPTFDVRASWAIRLTSGIRHIGFEIRMGLRHKVVGIDIWFWRAASIPVWERIRAAPQTCDRIVGTSWSFESVDGRDRTRMFLDRPAEDLRDETTWPLHHKWFAENLCLLYEKIAPELRKELENVGAVAVSGA
jgi:uncharacterized protein with ParB-like and HNH nuclease domain